MNAFGFSECPVEPFVKPLGALQSEKRTTKKTKKKRRNSRKRKKKSLFKRRRTFLDW